ncbi:NADH dehydrogenase [ubiquinone] 1 alpha subcomplex assembly factor 3 [Arctopsyche grandis]|uniref:NADH dehydrogenase [ubiquinone] 1 alpha subcomplex assembly factor 3 n=1 Tax=Arctopsyche grandis TaxID=121162 RepID=UPI00406D81F1
MPVIISVWGKQCSYLTVYHCMIEAMSTLTNCLCRTRVLKAAITATVKNHRNVRFGSSYDGDGQMRVDILNKEIDSGLMIDRFSQNGFKLNNGINILGPIMLFQKSVLAWRINDASEITRQSLSIFDLIEPQVDILIIGVGDADNIKSSRNLIKFGRELNTNIEIHSTEHAISAFNFLNAEKRNVAAALIPPKFIEMNEDDLAQSTMPSGFMYY